MTAASREDGWVNVLTNLGRKNRDPRVSTRYGQSPILTEQELTDLYRSTMARRVVDVPAQEMLRRGFRIETDDEEQARSVASAIESLRARRSMALAVQWSRLFGGALVVVGTDDGLSLEKPLAVDRLKKVTFLRVYDRHRVTPGRDIVADPANPRFGEPESYLISPVYTGTQQFEVHESRTLRFDGEDVPDMQRAQNDGWGDSALQAPYDSLRNLGVSFNETARIVERFEETVLRLSNLSAMLEAGNDEVVQKRITMIDTARSILRSIVVDKEDEFSKQASTLTGIPDILDRMMQIVSACTGIPVTVLMGMAPAGLQATGASDIRLFYDWIAAEQQHSLSPQLERLIELLFRSREGPTQGQEPPDWSIVFEPLWQPTDTEEADRRKTVAETDALYIDRGVVDPLEVAESRFGGPRFSADTQLDMELRKRMAAEPEPEPEPDPEPDPTKDPEADPEQDPPESE